MKIKETLKIAKSNESHIDNFRLESHFDKNMFLMRVIINLMKL